ncbi:Sec-independent protein translocase subunit TatA [Blastococcus capsensis]|uniref:Sec-independent protein translocase subunit TatA n=1 Tax=Blastococcus capsensis TaxID=1564163 RepID=UPI002540B028|nr:Sec-independent protein translocase subunit TatA [Blastococcus capsensis]MDK3255639.1 Sec-independent protein translocase subunit TatA [Blastococcus capsensis]
MNLGPIEIGLILLAVLLLFGYKKLPDASRSLGRSLRIFKGEMKGMKDDDAAGQAPNGAPARAEILPATDPRSYGAPGEVTRTPSAGADGAR